MKLSLFLTSLLASQASAFAPQQSTRASSITSLNLFGGNKGGGGDAKGPGMMDQLAMFKKAQEMASKKKEMDAELSKLDFEGTGADGKVKAIFKYIPSMNPMDPNAEYDPQSFDFDDEYFESASTEDLGAAIKEAIMDGVEKTNNAVAEKYAVLQADLMEAFQKKD